MIIYIKYNNEKKKIKTVNYQSIHSIISQYIEENNLDDNINNYYLDYNGFYLNNDLSLEKYDIVNKCELTLNLKNL
jgi:hypothetical protein